MPGAFVILVIVAALVAIAAIFRNEGPLTPVAVIILAVALVVGR
jgi:hypothetical protein